MGEKSSVIRSKDVIGVAMNVTPGHFATGHAHTNFYVDLTDVKFKQRMARQAAAALAHSYISTSIDAIICQEGTEMIGAFMADILSQPNMMAMNAGADICVLTPEIYGGNQLIFRENTLGMVSGSSVLLLISTISTGKTAERAVDCIGYYGGRMAGISALFSIIPEIYGIPVKTIFSGVDVIGYQTFTSNDCQMCDDHKPIDAIVNAFGYSEL